MVNTELYLNTKCRACFSEEQEMHHLFGEFDQGLSLSDILKTLSCFEVEENDGYSPYLCQSCTTIVVNFFNFKSIYKENEKYLKSLFKEQNVKSTILVNTRIDEDDKEESEIECNVKTSNEYDNTKENTEIENKTNESIIITELLEENFVEDDDQKMEITGGFIEPHILLDDQLQNENILEEENVEIIVSTKYSCEECGDCFLLKSGFQQHMLQKHKISISQFQKYSSKATIKVPRVSKLEDENIRLQCEICKDEFKTCADIEEHYKCHRKYICEHCGAGFIKKSYLYDHAEIHTTEKRHICPICGKAFRRRTVLVKHKKIHTHPRQCVCEICGLRFNDKGTLNTHIKLKHIKERNFNCTICGLWFPLKSTLEKHIYRHSENRDREYTCSICNMAYRDKSSLNRHMIIKHTENTKKPSCIYCSKQYTTNTNLLKHIRKHHGTLDIKNQLEHDQ